MAPIRLNGFRFSGSNAAAGAAAGFILPSFFGGGGGANATPLGALISYLPILALGGGALYAVKVLKEK
jgi:hypothetical protein